MRIYDNMNWNIVSGGLLGLLIGTLVASIGAWKDVRWEPFSWRTFIRSPIVAMAWGVVVAMLFPRQALVLVGLSAAALERVSVELWKGCGRRMPSKFKSAHRDSGWVVSSIAQAISNSQSSRSTRGSSRSLTGPARSRIVSWHRPPRRQVR